MYAFTLADWQARVAYYLPPDHENISTLDDLPAGHDLVTVPEEAREPDFYKMEFDGSLTGVNVFLFLSKVPRFHIRHL